MKSAKLKKKSKARRFAMQALYGWQISNNGILDIEDHYLAERNNSNFDVEYFKLLLHNIPLKKDLLEQEIIKHSKLDLDQIDPIELSILWVASYELIFNDIPFKIIISEALELVNMFSHDKSSAFINGVLDNLAKNKT